jgi:RHS repeat-associated protein
VAGAVTTTRRYDAVGNLEVGATNGYAFTGREWDSEGGLYYYRARYYDPKIGRFIRPDPLGFIADLSFYTYADNRPTTLFDPLGLQALPVQQCPVLKNPDGTTSGAQRGLCCDGGQYGLCVVQSTWPHTPEYARYCVQMHEKHHAWQRRNDPKPPCGQCSGDSCTLLAHPSTPPAEGFRRECAAWWISFLCFKGSGERDYNGRLGVQEALDVLQLCRDRNVFPWH